MDTELENPMGMVYQVYIQTDREKTEELVREAVGGGVKSVVPCATLTTALSC